MAFTMMVPVERIARPAWQDRPYRCRLGLHSFSDLIDEDIRSASQVCRKCGFINRFKGALLLECIRYRRGVMAREYTPTAPSRTPQVARDRSREDQNPTPKGESQ